MQQAKDAKRTDRKLTPKLEKAEDGRMMTHEQKISDAVRNIQSSSGKQAWLVHFSVA